MVREPADYAKLAIVVTLTASLVATASNTLMLSSKAIGGFQDKVSRAFDDTSLDEVLRSSMQQPIPATIAYRLLTENIARINKVTINSNKELELVYETSNPMNNGNSVVSGDYVEREVSLGGEVESTVLKVISPTKELNAPRTNMKEYATLSKLLQDSSFRYYVDFSNVPGSSDYDLVLYREVPRLIQATNISVSDSDNSDVATAIREAKAGIYRGNTLYLPGTSLPGTDGTSSDNATEKLQGGKFIGKVFVEDYKDSASWDTETNIPEGYITFRDAGGNELLALNNSTDNQAVLLTLGAVGSISDGDEITSGAVQMPNKSGIIKLSNDVKMVYTKTNPSTKVASNENNKEYLDKIAELESKISELSSLNDDATKDAEIERLNNLIAELETKIKRLDGSGVNEELNKMSPAELAGVFTVYDSNGNVDTWGWMTRSLYQVPSEESAFYNTLRNHDWRKYPELRIRLRFDGGGLGVYYPEWRIVPNPVPPFVYS